MTLWTIAAGAAAGIAALTGAYLAGDSAGANRVIARNQKAAQRIVAATARIQAATGRIAERAASAGTVQTTETREIIRESIRLVDRPVYRSVCVDADGSGLLDRARANANRGLAGEPDGTSARAAGVPAQP